MKTIEAASTARRNRILGAARRKFGASRNDKFVAEFLPDLFGRANVEDLEPYAPTEIAGFARSAAELLARRKPGRHVIHISDPDFDGRGRGSRDHAGRDPQRQHAVPARFDHRRDARISAPRSGSSPIRSSPSTRNGTGGSRISRLLRSGEGRRQCDPRKPDPDPRCPPRRREARQTLAARLDSCSAEVRRAVDDWRPMLARLDQAIAAYRDRRCRSTGRRRRGDRLPRMAARRQFHLPRHARVRLHRRRANSGESAARRQARPRHPQRSRRAGAQAAAARR